MPHLKTFLVSLGLVAVIDFLWIGLIANVFYLRQFGEMARLKPEGTFDVVLWAAVGIYLILALGVTFLALPLSQGRIAGALAYGALLGFCLYGVYDLTNHATLKHWPTTLMIVDIAWGTLLCAMVSAATLWVTDRI